MALFTQRADEEAARLYEEFVESFKADDVPGGKAFVRGGTINPNERVKHPHGHPPHSSPAPTALLGSEGNWNSFADVFYSGGMNVLNFKTRG